METRRYLDFERDIISWADRHPDVLALIATGAGARRSHLPDEWSDHDLWIMARPGSAEALRQGAWVPDPDRVVLSYRETPHGTNVVYDDGHLLEFAVFEPDELVAARVTDYRVLLGGKDVADRLETLAAQTTAETQPGAADHLFGRLISRLVIGVSRFGRGEDLSAHANVRSGALDALLAMITGFVPPQIPGAGDQLDPSRRFEATYPATARRINAALTLPLLDTAGVFLDIAADDLAGRAPGFSPRAIDAVRDLISRAAASRRS